LKKAATYLDKISIFTRELKRGAMINTFFLRNNIPAGRFSSFRIASWLLFLFAGFFYYGT